MNLMVLCARCDKNSVETNDYSPEIASRVSIGRNYRCSNKDELIQRLASEIIENYTYFMVYNGNDDDYQCPDLKADESILPREIIQCLRKIKSHQN